MSWASGELVKLLFIRLWEINVFFGREGVLCCVCVCVCSQSMNEWGCACWISMVWVGIYVYVYVYMNHLAAQSLKTFPQ